MSYRIDFTASNHDLRRLRKICLRILAVSAAAAACWCAYSVYKTYNSPTLDMKLREFESVAHKVEDVNRLWDETHAEWTAMLHYYRLVWADGCARFLEGAAASGASLFGPGYRPVKWTLKTGGRCRLEYRYVFEPYRYAFEPGGKAEQAASIPTNVVRAVESVVDVSPEGVSVAGVQTENLLNLEGLDISVSFSLAGGKRFPEKDAALAACVKEIEKMRREVQDAVLPGGEALNAQKTAKDKMMAYLPFVKDREDYPAFTNAIDIAGWFEKADRFAKNNPDISFDSAAQARLKAEWSKVGEARYPWDRFRELDNDLLVARKEAFESIASGIGEFKSALLDKHAECRARLMPLTAAYNHKDVSNENMIETDLAVRVAGESGIADARVEFFDDPGAPRPSLDNGGTRYVFVWVRWRLLLSGEELDAGKIAACAKKLTELGPGYRLDEADIEFDADGKASAAVLTGLMPVKKAEEIKENPRNVK